MLLIVGSIVVLISVFGGFVLSHGKLAALWMPFELMIIGGAAFGAFLISTPLRTVKAALGSCISVLKGPVYKKDDYISILMLLYELLNKARKDGLMSLEEHVEAPANSPIFQQYPKLLANHHLLDFITDCLRLMVGGSMDPHELEPLLDLELETHHQEAEAPAHALQKIADGLPGFGIVAAVLGIITTMASIGDGDVGMIGAHVAGALVGTFLGILLAYGFVGPTADAIASRAKEDAKAYECVKMALMASMHGYNPAVAIEFARKSLGSHIRPGFSDLEVKLKEKK